MVARHIDALFHTYALMLDASPEPFYKNIVQSPTAVVHADSDAVQR